MRFRTALAFATVALVAAAVGLAYYYLSQRSTPQLALTRGQPFARAAAPKEVAALQFEDATGRAHTLADFKGKLVLLNLWATWCAPCREEMPALDHLQAALGGPRFEVLALSVDQQGPEVARKFFADVGVKSLALYVDRSAQASFKLGAVGLPSTLLVDASGREIGRHVGPAKWDSPEVVESLRRRIEGPAH
jgi:thiol-disulfide isomerase/thioredoxin